MNDSIIPSKSIERTYRADTPYPGVIQIVRPDPSFQPKPVRRPERALVLKIPADRIGRPKRSDGQEWQHGERAQGWGTYCFLRDEFCGRDASGGCHRVAWCWKNVDVKYKPKASKPKKGRA